MRWFTAYWWKYLLETPAGSDKDVNWFKKMVCRASGHADVSWYTMSRMEPDMRCINCGDNLA